MIESGRMGKGVAAGAAAGALWGLVFLTPELAGMFSPLQLSAGRYLAFGGIALALLVPRWAGIRTLLSAREWRSLIWLSLAGNILYYVLLASAVQLGGIALTSLVIGFLPVAVTVLGSRGAGALPLRRLAPSLVPGIAGIACVGWEALASPAAAPRPSAPLGFLCALGALASWTAYAVGNSRCLARLPRISGHDWNLLTGTVTGALALLLVPAAFFGKQKAHSPAEWGLFVGVAFGVALFSSVIGNAFWNRASRLLPLTLVGSMILFETIFALLYACIREWRGPGIYETVAMILIGGSVLISVRAHRHPPVVMEEETMHP